MNVPDLAACQALGWHVFVSRMPRHCRVGKELLVTPFADLLVPALEHQRICQEASALRAIKELDGPAREVHNIPAPSLTRTATNLESLKSHAAGREDDAEVEALAETEASARRALEETLRFELNLRPTPMRHQSLRDALEAGLAGLTTEFHTEPVAGPIPL